MKIRRIKDGKVYQVHASKNAVIMGVEIRSRQDYLVRGTDKSADDVIDWAEAPPGHMWLDGYQVQLVNDATPVDVP